MKLLLLSDIHGNLAALEAVLAAEESWDQVVFSGDAVDYGPDPSACLAKLKELNPIRVRGNHDQAVALDVDCGCSKAFRDLSVASRQLSRSVLSPHDIAALGDLPTEARFTAGGAVFHVVHATPRDNLYQYASPDRNLTVWSQVMAVPEAGVLVVGHTHRPYVRPLGGVTVVNPGSVGQPRDGDPRASYATWVDGHFSLRRVSYDIDLTVRHLLAADLRPPFPETLARVLRSGGL